MQKPITFKKLPGTLHNEGRGISWDFWFFELKTLVMPGNTHVEVRLFNWCSYYNINTTTYE